MIDSTKVLTIDEVRRVLADLKGRSCAWASRAEIVFRLAVCCGLRVTEISELLIGDVYVNAATSHIKVRSKLKKGAVRNVPLHYDRATYEALVGWILGRQVAGAKLSDPLLVTARSKPIHRCGLRRMFRAACDGLGAERLRSLTIHHGRHTCASWLLHVGAPPQAVQAMLGHASLATTTIYAHLMDQVPTEFKNVWNSQENTNG